jgi:hypothetical protein
VLEHTLPDSVSVVTIGWGQISDGKQIKIRFAITFYNIWLCSETAGLVDDLNYVYLVTLSNEECRLAFGNQVNDNMVCVDGNYNEGTCKVRCRLHLYKFSITEIFLGGSWQSFDSIW